MLYLVTRAVAEHSVDPIARISIRRTLSSKPHRYDTQAYTRGATHAPRIHSTGVRGHGATSGDGGDGQLCAEKLQVGAQGLSIGAHLLHIHAHTLCARTCCPV